jgi:purine-binding chemotaxis protein CheW
MTDHSQTNVDEGLVAFVTFHVADHYFGVPVSRVQDILTPDTIAGVPLGPPEVRGLINLRGRIVTVIDVRTRLCLGASPITGVGKCVTVESDGEFYTLLVDGVGDVVGLSESRREPNPATLDPLWCEVANGVFRTGDKLLVSLDVERLLDIRSKA